MLCTRPCAGRGAWLQLLTGLATAQVRAARGLPDDLVRISAGIEDVDDLLAGE